MNTTATTAATVVVKASPWDNVKDNGKTPSVDIFLDLLDAESAFVKVEADYQARMRKNAPVLALRVHKGESRADIAREYVARMAADGVTVPQKSAEVKVGRMVRIGEAIIKAPKNAKIDEVITKESAKVNGNAKKGKVKPDAPTRTAADKFADHIGNAIAQIVKATDEDMAKIDGLVTTLTDALAARYAELDAFRDAAAATA